MHDENTSTSARAEESVAAFRRLEAAFGRLQNLHSRLRMANSKQMRSQAQPATLGPNYASEFEEAIAEYRHCLNLVETEWRGGAPPVVLDARPSVQRTTLVGQRHTRLSPPGSSR